MNKNTISNFLKINLIPEIGPIRFQQILSSFPDINKLFENNFDLLKKDKTLSPYLKKILLSNLINPMLEVEAENVLEQCQNKNIKMLIYTGESYPDLLKEIYSPPIILFYSGNINLIKTNCLAIVGPRLSSQYANRLTNYLAKELSSYGITIVSGLAAGIDTIAHSSTLKNKGNTIAVLGSGINNIYPANNKTLAKDIIANNGLILSEYVPDCLPRKTNFPLRNRIISGLSLGTVVIEAGKKSGALITAKYALNQNREVFAFPNKIGLKTSEGSNDLIKRGLAKLITNADDILEELNLDLKLMEEEQLKNLEKKQFELTDMQNKVYKTLTTELQSSDELANKLNLKINVLLAVLIQLELKGLIIRLPGNYFSIPLKK